MNLVVFYKGKSLSTYEIGKIKGVDNTTVHGWLKKYNIERRDQTEAWKHRKRPEWVEQLPELTKTKNAQDIAEQFGVKYHTVQYHIKKLGLTGTRVSAGMLEKRGVKRQRYTEEELRERYCEQKLTLKAIGEEFGVTAATVLADMRRFGIPSRSKAEASAIAWDNPEMKEAARVRAVARPALKFGQQTDIEKLFEEWAIANNIPVTPQFQLTENGHRYDYHLTGTKILVELDGDYWHSSEKQQEKDRRFEQEAQEEGYTVVRFLRSSLLKEQNLFDQLIR